MQFSFQDTNEQLKSCLIIGGGISGLVAGTLLQHRGIKVTILDKGRGIGGRLATRRINFPPYGEGVFDYGAQFFSVSHPQFQVWVDGWLKQGIVGEWSKQFSKTGKTCYRGIESNCSIAKYLAKDLTVHTQTRVVKVKYEDSHWVVEAEDKTNFSGEVLIITSPVPQALALLDSANVSLPTQVRQGLEKVTYGPCIAILALLEQPSSIPEPGGLLLNDPSLQWLACNQKKGISPQGNAVTLHSTPEFSTIHWDLADSLIAEKLFTIAAPWLGSKVVKYQVHRWSYSQPKTFYGKPYAAIQKPGTLVMAGDCFSESKVKEPSLNLEKAALSGIEAANYLLS